MTKENNSKVIRAGLGYTVGNYMLKGLAFFSIPIFSRLMNTSDYGQYNSFTAYESIVYVIIGLALHSSFKNAKYKFQSNFNQYISNCVTLGVINFLVWCIIANILYGILEPWIGFPRLAVNLLLVCSMGSAIIQYYNVYVSIDYQYKKFLAISSINAILSIVLSIFFMYVFFDKNRYMGRIIGIAIPIIVISLYIIFSFYKKAKPKLNKEYTKYALRFSIPIIPHGISQVILSQFDRIMIRNIIGSSEAGIYSFAYNIYTIIQVTASSLDNVWGPWLYEKINTGDYKSIRVHSSNYISGMQIFSSCILLVSPEIIKILSPPSYWDSIYTVVPIVIGGFFAFLYTLPVQVEYYYEKTNYIAIGTFLAAIVNVVLNLLFVPKWGYIAAAYTTLATYALYFLFHFILAWKFAKINIFNSKMIFLNIITIIVIGVITFVLVEKMIIRWIISLILFCVMMFFANLRYDIFKKIIKRIKGKK